MTTTEKNVDDLIRLRQEKQFELQLIGKRIKESAESIVVAFVDLANSTAMKGQFPPDQWLGYVYDFLQTVYGHTRSSGGTVVKRIGDELMLSLRTVADAEKFLRAWKMRPHGRPSRIRQYSISGRHITSSLVRTSSEIPTALSSIGVQNRKARETGCNSMQCSIFSRRRVGGLRFRREVPYERLRRAAEKSISVNQGQIRPT